MNEQDNRISETPYFDARMEKKKKRNKVIGIILLVIAFAAGIFAVRELFFRPDRGTGTAPVPVTEVNTPGVYVSDTMTYMTDTVACLTSAENHIWHIAACGEGDDFHLTVICITEDDIDTYMPYIEYGYDVNAPEPEPYELRGYTALIDSDLENLVKEGFADFYGFEPTKEEYAEYVLPVYIAVGNAKAEFSHYVLSVILIIAALASLIVGCYLLLQREASPAAYDSVGADYRRNTLPIGIICAIIGASLGGIAWILVGMAGFVCTYIGTLIALCSFAGFNLFCKDHTKFGLWFCFVLSILTVFIATFMSLSVAYYREYNDGTIGYVTFRESATAAYTAIRMNGSDSSFWKNLIIGEIFAVIGAGACLSRKKKQL